MSISPDIANALYFAAIAFFAVVALIPLGIRWAVHIGFVDKPGGRKTHDIGVPPIGGILIFPVFILLSLLSGANGPQDAALYIALSILLAAGFVDDRHHLSYWVKFGAQILASVIVVIFGGAYVQTLGNLFGFGDIWMDVFSIPFSIIAMVLFINGLNLIDGVDGLAGGITFVMFCFFVFASFLTGQVFLVPVMLIFLAALAGFLFYNMRSPLRKRASVFLGDAGSMCAGLIVGWFAVKMAFWEAPVVAPITVAWIIGLPVFDECAQFYRRVREGRHPFSPDRGHLHHHLLDAGFTPGQTTSVILLIVAAMSGIGLAGHYFELPDPILSYLWILCILGHMAISEKPQRYVRFFRKIRQSGSGMISQEVSKSSDIPS